MSNIDQSAVAMIIQATQQGIAPFLDGDGWVCWEVNNQTVLLGYSGFVVLDGTCSPG